MRALGRRALAGTSGHWRGPDSRGPPHLGRSQLSQFRHTSLPATATGPLQIPGCTAVAGVSWERPEPWNLAKTRRASRATEAEARVMIHDDSHTFIHLTSLIRTARDISLFFVTIPPVNSCVCETPASRNKCPRNRSRPSYDHGISGKPYASHGAKDSSSASSPPTKTFASPLPRLH